MSHDDVQEVRQLLEQHANRAPRPSGLRSTTVRRARVHRVGVTAFTCLALVAVLIAGIRITTLINERNDRPGKIRVSPARHGQNPTPSDEIAFTRYRGEGAIYVLNTNGQLRKVISEGPYAIAGPAWSPDGQKIAFHGFFGRASMSKHGEGGGLFVVDSDGSHLKFLHFDGADPSWSPDGQRIAFYAGGAMYLIGADGHGFEALTDKVQGLVPTWSPDGNHIAFDSPSGSIYVVRTDGFQLHRIAGHKGVYLRHPAWSPDGTRIAFERYPQGGRGDIYTMNTDGSNEALVVANAAEPAWSPDGTRIAFTRARAGHRHIYEIDIDGTGLTQLTQGTGDDAAPEWKPAP